LLNRAAKFLTLTCVCSSFNSSGDMLGFLLIGGFGGNFGFVELLGIG
jgi:hypothetical protein